MFLSNRCRLAIWIKKWKSSRSVFI